MILLLLTSYPQFTKAYNWEAEYGLSLTAGYDDNYRLTESNELETSSAGIRLFSSAEGETEISSLRIGASAGATNYSESEIDDSDFYGLSLDTSRSGERFTGSLGLSLESRSTAETERLDTGVIEDGNRETVTVSPGISYAVNERNSMSLGLSAQDVSYDTESQTDFKNNAATLSWTYRLDETSNLTGSYNFSRYDPDSEDDETDTQSVGIGYGWSASEATSYVFSTGYTDVDRPDDSENGYNFAFSINHERDERNTFTFAVSNSYQPSGEGQVREENRLSLAWAHALSDRAQFTLSSSAVETDDRDYFTIQAGANYSYTPQLNLAASFRHAMQESDFEDASSNSVFFTLSYFPSRKY